MIENFTPTKISEAEHRLVVGAKARYGPVFENAEGAIGLIWNFVSSAEPEAWIFMSFHGQVGKFALLALLSIVRQHTVQAKMNLRHLFEAGVLAAYALVYTDEKVYYQADDQNRAYEKKGVRHKASRWLEEKYPIHSKSIKKLKKIINEFFAHSSIVLTPMNFEMSKVEGFKSTVFDRDNELITKSDIWFVANSCLTFLDLFAQVITDTRMVKLATDFQADLHTFASENERIKKELMQAPRLQRWL